MGHKTCPRCPEGLLLTQRYHETPVERCEACQGFLVGLRDLRRIAENLARDLVGVIDLDAEIDHEEGPTDAIACECGVSMEGFQYLGTPKVRLDRCEECMLVWLDADELPAVARVCARSEGRIRALYETARRENQTTIDNPAAFMRRTSRHALEHDLDALSVLQVFFR